MGWVSQLGPVATGLVALVALVVGTLTVLQRSRADRRDQWWKRAQWAIDLTFAGQAERQKLAFRVLGVLGESKLAGAEELRILDSLAADELRSLAPVAAEQETVDPGDTGGRSGQEVPE